MKYSRRGVTDMTIRQEACEKIMKLPDDGVRLILVMADEIARQHNISLEEKVEVEKDMSIEMNISMTRKQRAFQDMLEMREKSTYPKDFDYKKVLEKAINEKYDFVD